MQSVGPVIGSDTGHFLRTIDMYIGIDLGTSGVKVILLNEQGEVVASQTEKLTVSRPASTLVGTRPGTVVAGN
ncbi:FGGY family carbohydrate kinase [Escherichia coli]|nr:FGGY family carbohydrate kinase [Escherichia coli]